eukprot:TRINITY_DN55231_c0_g1_i1.p1 TRINITY_DN55231_c0_g1~~TRINITY_DN55231_c0_g1_i1.p1  ORF type:complete len:393 (+),score=77.16 TRINITY_DN55231_c0_g1_i1:59-1180(+)
MPARQNSKRDVEAGSKVSSHKKARSSDLATVVAILDRADHLSASCRSMLKCAAPKCLCAPACERTDLQTMFVKWIAGVVDGFALKLHKSIESEDAKVAEATSAKEVQEKSLQVLRGELVSTDGKLRSIDDQLVQSRDDERAAESRVAESQAAQRRFEASQEQAKSDQALFEEFVSGRIEQLKGTCDATQIDGHLELLLPAAKRNEVDGSFLVALPVAARKLPSERSSFDAMVFDELERSLARKAVDIADRLATTSSTAAELATAMDSANAELASKLQARQQLEDQRADVVSGREPLAFAVSVAERKLQSLQADIEKASSLRDAKSAALSAFQDHDVACFARLRGESDISASSADDVTNPEVAASSLEKVSEGI